MNKENKKQKNKNIEQNKNPEAKQKEREEERIVRILSKDIEGKMSLYSGLSKIKGVSWSLSNAICKIMGLDKKRRIGSLKEGEIEKIEEFIKKGDFPKHLKNRRNDLETGEDKHLTGSDLDLKKEFDIKRLKNIKSYRGHRHVGGLPTRGQKTRSNFRKNKSKGAGIRKKK